MKFVIFRICNGTILQAEKMPFISLHAKYFCKIENELTKTNKKRAQDMLLKAFIDILVQIETDNKLSIERNENQTMI